MPPVPWGSPADWALIQVRVALGAHGEVAARQHQDGGRGGEADDALGSGSTPPPLDEHVTHTDRPPGQDGEGLPLHTKGHAVRPSLGSKRLLRGGAGLW